MPTPNKGGYFRERPMRHEELTLWLREVLTLAGFAMPSLLNVGMHTPKHTLLSWCSKFGVKKDVRRDLGGHVQAADHSVAAYSRDMLAMPLRKLEDVLEAVANGSFDPEATRSGRFRREPKAEATQGIESEKEDTIVNDGSLPLQVDDQLDEDMRLADKAPVEDSPAATEPADLRELHAARVPDPNDPMSLFEEEDDWDQEDWTPKMGDQTDFAEEVGGMPTPPQVVAVSEASVMVDSRNSSHADENYTPTEPGDSDTDEGPTSAEESDDMVDGPAEPLPESDEEKSPEHTEDEDEKWYSRDVPYYYVTEKATKSVISDPLAGVAMIRDEAIPSGGLWMHRVWKTIHKRGEDTQDGMSDKLRCGRRGLYTTYIKVDGWPELSRRCQQCFP